MAKLKRDVSGYKKRLGKRLVRVSGYTQTYIVPRGPYPKHYSYSKNESRTYWVKDSQGRFKGRASNLKEVGKSKRYGADRTYTRRDKSYGRIFGRHRS